MPAINDEIIRNLYGGVNPFLTAQRRFIDDNYPHTNIRDALIDYLIQTYRPSFWLELGSFVGGSAIKVAESIKKYKAATGVVCCDPFCGDVNMWSWEVGGSDIAGKNGEPYEFLGLENGIPTIYQRFLANVVFNGHSDVITPIQTTSIIGVGLVERLYKQKRITVMPSVIYLDSAHEANETYLELEYAWRLLPRGGILFGDDWDYFPGVKKDVLRFSRRVSIDRRRLNEASRKFAGSKTVRNIFLYDGQWVLFKKN